MNKNTIVLLSGGLDSLVSIALLRKEYDIKKALHINYGQKPASKELEACKKMCTHYDIELEVLNLDWYAKISSNSALSQSNSQTNEQKSYWMPNRNALFLNIAGSYADALNCKFIAIGANKEEAQTFSDNSVEFIDSVTKLFETSTQNKVKVIAPLINYNKNEIIKKAIDLNAPLELVWSCYDNKEKHCGTCPSCNFLKTALIQNNKKDLLEKLF